MERARAQDPGNARLPALTTCYYNLLKKFGIQPLIEYGLGARARARRPPC